MNLLQSVSQRTRGAAPRGPAVFSSSRSISSCSWRESGRQGITANEVPARPHEQTMVRRAGPGRPGYSRGGRWRRGHARVGRGREVWRQCAVRRADTGTDRRAAAVGLRLLGPGPSTHVLGQRPASFRSHGWSRRGPARDRALSRWFRRRSDRCLPTSRAGRGWRVQASEGSGGRAPFMRYVRPRAASSRPSGRYGAIPAAATPARPPSPPCRPARRAFRRR